MDAYKELYLEFRYISNLNQLQWKLQYSFMINYQSTLNIQLGHSQSFMQDNIIASHTCFGGHVEVNC